LVRDANTARAEQRRDDAATLVATVVELAGVLGINPKVEVPELDQEIAALVTERDEARARKDFATSDRIRGELLARGIALEDTPMGTVWRRT
jgi:cysteinyl-tRNA synthetase